MMQRYEHTPIEAESYQVVDKHLSPFQLSMQRFLQNKLAVAGLIVLTFMILVAIFGPLFVEHSPTEANLTKVAQSPSKEHILGTDLSGRDNFSRLIYGSR